MSSRDRERERDRGRARDQERDWDRDRWTHGKFATTDQNRHRNANIYLKEHRDRGRERERERDRDRDRDRGRDRRDYRGRDRDRDYRRDRDRRSHHSRSPPRQRTNTQHGPPPDLSTVQSIDKRVRMKTLWDMKPPGYENVTTEMAKLSGMFPLPGTGVARPNNFDQVKLKESSNIVFDDRTARRVIVEGAVEPGLESLGVKYKRTGNVVEIFDTDKIKYVLGLDGVKGRVPGFITDSTPSIVVGKLDETIPEDQANELLRTFGEVDKFEFKPRPEGSIAYCEYKTMESADMAVKGLNDMLLGKYNISVKYTNKGIEVPVQASPFGTGQSIAMLGQVITENNRLDKWESSTLQLLNLMSVEDLTDNNRYNEILEEVTYECEKFGKVLKVVIPKPDPKYMVTKRLTIQVRKPEDNGGADEAKEAMRGVGKAFVKFDSPEACRTALERLGGRKFNDRTVLAAFYWEYGIDNEAF